MSKYTRSNPDVVSCAFFAENNFANALIQLFRVKQRHVALLIVTALVGILGGCGTNAKPQFAKGVFIDSPVEGLSYVSGTIASKTLAGGVFSYQVGSSIKFYVGDVLIGEATPGPVLSPIDLVPGATDVTNPKVLKIVNFLLALNSSKDVEQGMLIAPDKHAALKGVAMDLRDDATTLASLQTTLQGALKTTLAFGNTTTARLHLKSSLAAAQAADTPEFSFVFTGDSTLEPAPYLYFSPLNPKYNASAGAAAFANISSTSPNTRALSRILLEVSAQRPQMFVTGGNMTKGFGSSADPVVNASALQSQYRYGRDLMASLFEPSLLNPAGIYVLPVPGEREMADQITTASSISLNGLSYTSLGNKVSTQANEQIWVKNMQDLILDNFRFGVLLTPKGLALASFDPNNYPLIGSENNIFTSQKYLSYSFEIGSSHFVVINTDPANPNDPVNSTTYSAPTNWLKQDLAAAHARTAIKHIFIFGHRPAWSYIYGDNKTASLLDGLDGKDAAKTQARAAAFWDLVEQYQATYFAGHMNIFNAQQGAPVITDTATYNVGLFSATDGAATPANAAASKVFLRYTGVVGANYPNVKNGKSWQVICGSAGASLIAAHPAAGATTCVSTVSNCSTNPDNFMYAWVLVTVYKASANFPKGRVHLTAYGFDDKFGKTRVVRSWDLENSF